MQNKTRYDRRPHALRTPAEKSETGLDDRLSEEPVGEEQAEDEEVILCRNCHAMITSPSERIMVDGLHRHTFANPHGIVFEIGCFRNAKGCTYAGPITDDFSWFKGYHWQIAVCGSCLQHMGWVFRSVDGQPFHGLVLDRLKSGTA